MSVDVGTHIDLSHLNKVPAVAPKKKTFSETIGNLVEVGTSFTFTPELKVVRHIPVISI